LFLYNDCLVVTRVDDTNHAIVYARAWGAAVVPDGVRVIDADCEGWWIGKDNIYRLEAREEPNLVYASVFIGYARKFVF
jgi:hypothetical protein